MTTIDTGAPEPTAPAVRRAAPGLRRERRDAAVHRRQVLEAAARLFEQRGVEAVTMDEIAHAARVGKGTLYRRYPDKGQLVLALMEDCVGELQARVTASVSGPRAPNSAMDRLEALLGHLLGWVEEHTAWLGVVSDVAAGERRHAVYRGALYQWLHAAVEQVLRDAVANGEADIPDPVYTADALLAMLDISLYQFQRHERGYSPEQIGSGLCRLVEGLRTPRRPLNRKGGG